MNPLAAVAREALDEAYDTYLAWQIAACKDTGEECVADESTFLDWVRDELMPPKGVGA